MKSKKQLQFCHRSDQYFHISLDLENPLILSKQSSKEQLKCAVCGGLRRNSSGPRRESGTCGACSGNTELLSVSRGESMTVAQEAKSGEQCRACRLAPILLPVVYG